MASLLNAIYTRQFTIREWPQLHAPRHSVQLIRATDRCLQIYIQSLNERNDLDIHLHWQYRLWPHELTVALAPENATQLAALPGFDAGELRAALTAGIDEWLSARGASAPFAVTPVTAGALS